MKIIFPDIFFVSGMPGNGKTWFANFYGKNISNSRVIHLDLYFSNDEDVYSYCNSNEFDINKVLEPLYLDILRIVDTTCFFKSLILEGYVATLYSEQIKNFIKEKFKFNSFFDINLRYSMNGYVVSLDNKEIGTATNYEYFEIIKKIDAEICEKKNIVNQVTYQEFDWSSTKNSNSFMKYDRSFKNEDLFNKSFLDIGCNSGYFCFKARSMGANRVIGIDNNEMWTVLANEINKYYYNFGNVEFYTEDIFNYNPLFKFDYVYCSSVFHYFKQKHVEFINKTASIIKPGGLFFLEVEISDKTTEINRPGETDKLFYPDKKYLESLLNLHYNIEGIKDSYMQRGSIFNRYIYKLRKK